MWIALFLFFYLAARHTEVNVQWTCILAKSTWGSGPKIFRSVAKYIEADVQRIRSYIYVDSYM